MFFSAVLILFQLSLALGAPWGAASMGGKYPGVYPSKMRFVAVVNAAVIGLLSAVVLAHAEFAFSVLNSISNWAIWIVAAFYGLSIIINSITPSKIERIWAPVALLQTLAVIYIALN